MTFLTSTPFQLIFTIVSYLIRLSYSSRLGANVTHGSQVSNGWIEALTGPGFFQGLLSLIIKDWKDGVW